MKSKKRNFFINATTAAILFSSISAIPLNVGAATQLFLMILKMEILIGQLEAKK